MAKAWKKRKCRVDPSAVEIEGARAQGLALAEAWTRMRVLVYLCQYRDLPDRGLTPHSTKFNEWGLSVLLHSSASSWRRKRRAV